MKGSRNYSVEVQGHKSILLSPLQELSTILVPNFLSSLGEIPGYKIYTCVCMRFEYVLTQNKIIMLIKDYVHWEDPEGWDGEGGGRGDQDGEYM